MSIQNCMAKLLEVTGKAGLKLSRQNLELFAAQLESKRADLLTRQEFAKAAGELLEEQFIRQAEARKVRLAMDTAVVKGASSAIRKGEFAGKDIVDNVANWIHGGAVKKSKGGRIDPRLVAAHVSTNLRKFWNNASRPFSEIISKRLLIDEIFQERAAIRDGLKPGLSGSAEAVGIAKAMHATSNEIFDVKAAYNPDMVKNENFLASRFWEREKVSAVPKEEMVAFWEQHFTNSFPELDAAERIARFESIYDRIKAGVYGTIQDTVDAEKYIVGDSLRSDIMRRMARSRKLTANNWQAEAEAFKRFGPDTVGDLMGRVIQKTGKDVSMLTKFGSNPRENFNKTFNDIFARSSEADRVLLQNGKKKLESIFAQVAGEGDGPANSPLGKWTQGVLTAQYAAKTGLSYLSMLPDLGLAAGQLRALNGRSILGNSLDVVGSYIHAMGSDKFRNQHLEDMVIYASSAHGNLIGASVSPDRTSGVLGRLNWVAEKVGVLGLHERHVASLKAAEANLIGKWLSRMSDTKFGDLEARAKNGFESYGIGEHEWDAIRSTFEEHPDHGKFITVQGIEHMPDEAVVEYMHRKGLIEGGGEATPSKEAIFLARKNMAISLGVLINDHADYSTSSPTSKQKSLMFGGQGINSTEGQLRRLFFQFKGAALTTASAYKRLYYAEGKVNGGDLGGVAAAMAAGMFWFGVKEYAKSSLQGKSPEDPMDPKFFTRMFVGSGIGGIAADGIMGGLEGHGSKDIAEKVVMGFLGPAPSEAAKGIGLAGEYVARASKAYQGEEANFGPANRKALDMVWGNIPGQNLMNAKNVMNYFFLNEAREFLDEGYLRALEENVNETPGNPLFSDRQEYFLGGPSFWQ